MALMSNTIEFVFTPQTANVPNNTRNDFAAITLDIPETTSRTFTSVILEVTARETDGVAQSLTAWLLGIKLGAVAFSDVVTTNTMTNSGEEQTWLLTRDVTSYFNTNFGAGASQTCQAAVRLTTPGANNLTAKLIITYVHDDADTTRIKTARIPFDSNTARLITTLQEMGTNQVPDLDDKLPEASKVYRQIFFELYANEAATTTTDLQLSFSLDAEAEVTDGLHEQALTSSVWYKYHWIRNDLDTTNAHAFKIRALGATNTFTNMSVVLCVTYEYDHATTTRTWQSLLLPGVSSTAPTGGATSGDKSVATFEFWIEEPGTITLEQSAVLCFLNASGTVNLTVAAGAATPRLYLVTQGSIQCGQYTLNHRIDSGGASGAGITLARGLNTLTLEWYADSQVVGSLGTSLTALLCLNYTADKTTTGNANRTLIYGLGTTAASVSAGLVEVAAVAPSVPESLYYVNGVVLRGEFQRTASAQGGGVAISAERQSGEGPADGWVEVYAAPLETEDEMGLYTIAADATKLYDRHPVDPDGARLALETTRKYRMYTTAAHWSSLYMLLTYHSIPFTVAGNATDYTGTGGGLTVNVHRADTHELEATTTTAVGGGFSATVYDNTIKRYVTIWQDSTHFGRSDDEYPV